MATDIGPVTIMSRPKSTQIDTVIIDTAVTETHTGKNTITDHPVEEGFNPSDHSRPDPDQLSLECIISNTPLSQGQMLQAVQSGAFTFQTTAAAPAPRNTPGRAEAGYNALLDLKNKGTLIVVITRLRTYRSMAIESISVPLDAKTFDAVRFTIAFKQVRVVQNKLTRNVVSKDKRVGSKVKTGAQTPKAPEQEESGLFAIADGTSKSSNKSIAGVGNFLLSGGSGGQSVP